MNREETRIDKEFSPNKIPAQYADKPNLWWMACELLVTTLVFAWCSPAMYYIGKPKHWTSILED